MTGDEEQAGSRRAVRCWRWRIAGGNGLPVAETLRVGEAMREMLIEAARWSRGSHELPLCLHGPTPDHSHARYLPEDEDGDGLIDHLTVLATGGLDGVAIRLLAMSERLFVPQLGAHDIGPVWMGAEPQGALFARSSCWRSRTPYVAPWHGDKLEAQVRKELRLAGLSPVIADEVEVTRDAARGCRGWQLERADDKPPPSPPRAAFLQLRFPVARSGPLILGYGSHFGLGQFVGVQP